MNKLNHIELFMLGKRPHTRNTYKHSIACLRRFTGKSLRDTTELDAARYINYLRTKLQRDGEPTAPATVRLRFNSLHSIFQYILDLRQIELNPFSALKRTMSARADKQKRPTQFFSRALVRRMLEQPKGRSKKAIRDRAALAILFGAGLRRSELLALGVADVLISSGGRVYLSLKHTKSGIAQTRALASFAQRLVGQLVSQRKREGATEFEPLFVFYSASGAVRGRMSDSTLARLFRRYAAAIGVKAAPHSARATFATRLKEMGFHDRDVASALGHKTEHMVRLYDKRANDHKTSVAKKLKY